MIGDRSVQAKSVDEIGGRKKKNLDLRQEGIEPPARRWQRRILPLNH